MGTQQLIADIWAEVFKLDRVEPDDDFFDLGGSSLQAAQIATRVREQLGIDIPLRIFFETSTLKELVSAIEALR